MGTFSDLSDVIRASTTSGEFQQIPFFINDRENGAAGTATVAGRWSFLWTFDKAPAGKGAAIGAWTNPAYNANGAIGQNAPGGSRQNYLTCVEGVSSQAGMLVLIDVLGANGNLNGTTTSAQTYTGSLTRLNTRATGATGNRIGLIIPTIIGTTATTVTVKYTNAASTPTTGQVSPAVAIGGTGLREATRFIPVPFKDGDDGVTALEDCDLVASTTTAGGFGGIIYRPIINIPVQANTGFRVGLTQQQPVLAEIDTDACLSWLFLANGTAAPQINGKLYFAQK